MSFENVPAELCGRPYWLVWRLTNVAGEKKPRKSPFYVSGVPRHGTQGTEEDRAQLVTFDRAVAACKAGQYSGIGLAILPGLGYYALDFDDCVVDGRVDGRVLPCCVGTYAEYSPSGTGVRVFLRGDLQSRKDNKREPQIELFGNSGFVTVTGRVLPECEMADWPISTTTPAVESMLRARFGEIPAGGTSTELDLFAALQPRLGLDAERVALVLAKLPKDLHYDDWVKVGMAVHHETDGAGFDMWWEWSKTSPKAGDEKYARDRWKSFGKYVGGQHLTFAWVMKLAGERSRTREGGFTLIPAHAFATVQKRRDLIKHLLPREGIAMVYGASGSGKTFAVLDLAMAVARGVPWRGRKVVQGRVVYIVAEGAGGFRQRLIAYAKARGVDLTSIDLQVIAEAPNLLTDDHQKLAQSIGTVDLVIVDTLAQVTPGGDENSAQDMGRALANVKQLRDATGGLALLVHHSGKDADRGPRGWSGARAAMDVVLEVVRTGDAREMRIAKLKDGNDEGTFPFTLKVVDLGIDEDGDQITSCAVEHSESQIRKRGEPTGAVQRLVYGQAPGTVDDVITRAAALMSHDPQKRDKRREHAHRALQTLIAEKWLVKLGDEFVDWPGAAEPFSAGAGSASF